MLLSLIIAFLFCNLTLRLPRNYLFQYKKMIPLDSAQKELNFSLTPGKYFLKIKYKNEKRFVKQAFFNGKAIRPFKVREKEIKRNGSISNRSKSKKRMF